MRRRVHLAGLDKGSRTGTRQLGSVCSCCCDIKGHIQGQTEVLVSLDNGRFSDDFEGECEFKSSVDRPMPVEVKSPANVKSQRVLTLNTADSQDIYGLL